MSTVMRAKMKVTRIDQYTESEHITFSAVYKDGAYPADGSDEDNTYSKFTPQAELSMVISNPALVGQFTIGDKFYVDFTRAV